MRSLLPVSQEKHMIPPSISKRTAACSFHPAPWRHGAVRVLKSEMKKTVHSIICALLSLVFILCLASCGNTVDKEGLWESATYRKDTTVGKGDTTVYVEVKAGDESVTFTVKTDKKILGDALLEHKLITGEESQYGLYIKSVNGITADYDVDKSYWGFYKNGEYMMTGVDGTEIADGEHYELVYSK